MKEILLDRVEELSCESLAELGSEPTPWTLRQGH